MSSLSCGLHSLRVCNDALLTLKPCCPLPCAAWQSMLGDTSAASMDGLSGAASVDGLSGAASVAGIVSLSVQLAESIQKM